MTLSGNELIEASLLKPTDEEHGASPIPEEEAILLGDCVGNLRPHPSWNAWRSLNHQSPWSELMLSLLDPLSKLTLLVPLFFPPLHPNPAATLPRRQRNTRERLRPAQSKQVSGSTPTYRQMKVCQNGGGSSDSFFTLRTSTLAMSKSRGSPAGKPQPSGCQPHSGKKMAGGPLHPVWVCLRKGTIFPQRSSREFRITERHSTKKCWHWPWPSRGAPFIL